MLPANVRASQKKRTRRIRGVSSTAGRVLGHELHRLRERPSVTSSSVGMRARSRKQPRLNQADQLPLAFQPSNGVAVRRGRRPGGVRPNTNSTGALARLRNICPPQVKTVDVIAAKRRTERRLDREVLWDVSVPGHRVLFCGKRPASATEGPILVDKAGVAHFAGLQTCGSIWDDPCCSAVIRSARAEEISAAAAVWCEAGNSVFLAAMTVPHDQGMPLRPLFDVISKGFTFCISGRPWRRLCKRVGIVGTIRAVEVTNGSNGWHPHTHSLIFIEGQADAAVYAAVTLYLRDRWRSYVTRAGFRLPSWDHGVKVDICQSAAEAGAYVAKLQESGRSPGNEMARGDMKRGKEGHRTPFELLRDFRLSGDKADLDLFREYQRVTKGRQCITWSAGLRKRLLAELPEQTDEEIAAEEIGGDHVLRFGSESWRQVVRVRGLSTRIQAAYDAGGLAAVAELLAAHGHVIEPAELVPCVVPARQPGQPGSGYDDDGHG